MRRSAGAVVVFFALVALPVSASAATKTVYAGPPPTAKKIAGAILGKSAKQFLKTYHPEVNSFFLSKVTINAGDSVSFVINGFHTVDLPAAGQGDLPLVTFGSSISGVNDAAGSPFWFNGKPSSSLNPALFARSGPSSYDGTARVESGIPQGKGTKPLNVTFPKAGTYKFYCDIHPGMIGYVVVNPKGNSVPSPKQDAAALKKQITQNILLAKKLAKSTIPSDQVSVGVSGAGGIELYQMFPATLRVKTGAVVTFAMSTASRDFHTATFGPQSYLTVLTSGIRSAPTLPPAAVYPSDQTQPISLSPSSHGNGFANTGFIDRDAATVFPASGKIKFGKAGTYHFICLIHPQMQGTVIVK
jgi:plastocyanin